MLIQKDTVLSQSTTNKTTLKGVRLLLLYHMICIMYNMGEKKMGKTQQALKRSEFHLNNPV